MKMSRPLLPAVYLLLAVLCFAGRPVRGYPTLPYAEHHPLEALFRAQPPTQHRAGVVTAAADPNAPSSASHGSLAPEHHPLAQQQQQQKPGQSTIPMAQHRGVLRRRAAEPGGPAANRPHWHADQRPAVFGGDALLPAFRALPALDIGRPGSAEDYADQHPRGARPLDAFDLPGDPAENEIGDGGGPPLSAVALGPLGHPHRVAPGGRATESIDLIREQLERIKQEEDIEIKSNLLMKLLTELPEGPLPIVYIEDAAGLAGALRNVPSGDDESDGGDDGDDADDDDDDGDDEDGLADENEGRRVTEHFTPNGGKRSGRYYRRYPWKRQNSRSRPYDAEARYLCVPSREDVFKLLVGLHENRVGNHQRTVNFCNRKRPAKAIFTNIRFLG